MDTIICPKCGTENPAGAMNCRNCRINLRFALEHPDQIEGAKHAAAPRDEAPTQQAASQATLRRSALFASICVLPPLAYLLLWLFDAQELWRLGEVNLVFAMGAWGPAFFPLMIALYPKVFNQFYVVIAVALAAIAWFIVAFFVHRLVRRTWAAAAIMIVLCLFFSALNFFALISVFGWQ